MKKSLFLFILFFAILGAEENKYPLSPCYYAFEDIPDLIRNLTISYPDAFSYEIIGHSGNDALPIYALRVSLAADSLAPAILLVGQHHSEEPLGEDFVLHYAQFLAEHLQKQDVRELLKKCRLYFIPTLNPEGDRVFRGGSCALKRKNNSKAFGVPSCKEGVDLNKNYSFNLDEDGDDNPASPYYKGAYPASESEIVAAERYFEKMNFSLAFFFHSSLTGSYAERIFFPWHWEDEISEDYDDMRKLAYLLAAELPRDYRRGNYNYSYARTSRQGFARDYIYANYGTYAFTVEVGGINKHGISVVWPTEENYRKLMTKLTRAMNKFLPLCVRGINNSSYTGKAGVKLANYHYDRVPYPFHKTDAWGNAWVFSEKVKKSLPLGSVLPILRKKAFIMVKPTVYDFDIRPAAGNLALELYREHKLIFSEDFYKIDETLLLPLPAAQELGRNVFYLSERDAQGQPLRLPEKYELVCLQKDREVLKFYDTVSQTDPYYLDTQTKLGVDFGVDIAGTNNYKISEVFFEAKALTSKAKVKICLRNGQNGEVFLEDELLVGEKKQVYRLKCNTEFSAQTYVELENTEHAPILIYCEGNSYHKVNAGRNYVFYSSWQAYDGNDFCLGLKLEARE